MSDLRDQVQQQVSELLQFQHELVPGAVKAMQKETGAKSSDLWNVPLSGIHVRPGYNPRVMTPAYLEGLERLADSIEENGYYPDKPLGCVIEAEDGQNKLYIEEGHRRFAAVQIVLRRGNVKIETLPVAVLPRTMTPAERLVHMVRSNNDGVPFKPLELAIVVARLVKFGNDDSQIAKQLGITTAYVRQLKTLAGAPQSIRDLVESGDISSTLAIETLQQHKDEAPALIQEAVAEAQAEGKKATMKTVKKAAAKKKLTPKQLEAKQNAKTDRLQKKNYQRAFELLGKVIDQSAKKLDNVTYSEIETLFVDCGMPF
jgi:ParB family chromosome partitioning protein